MHLSSLQNNITAIRIENAINTTSTRMVGQAKVLTEMEKTSEGKNGIARVFKLQLEGFFFRNASRERVVTMAVRAQYTSFARVLSRSAQGW